MNVGKKKMYSNKSTPRLSNHSLKERRKEVCCFPVSNFYRTRKSNSNRWLLQEKGFNMKAIITPDDVWRTYRSNRCKNKINKNKFQSEKLIEIKIYILILNIEQPRVAMFKNRPHFITTFIMSGAKTKINCK